VTGVAARVRELVLDRDGYHCLGCGVDVRTVRWYSLQHRRARGVGGSNGPENLATVCGSATSPGCHLLCEARDLEMTARGLYVPSWNDPADVPVILWTGRMVYLTEAGTYGDFALSLLAERRPGP
jgi:hypothetical protein